jgi:hypothetical protein
MIQLVPCQGCVFHSDGYADFELGTNFYCTHPTYARCEQQCPTVLSYMIKVNLGLIKEDEEVPEQKFCPCCGETVITDGGNCKYCVSCGWRMTE